ncbi:hypothetical protein D9M68_946590 [compost metagenome]
MHVHRVAPALAAGLDVPHFERTEGGDAGIGRAAGQFGRGVQSARIHVETEAAIRLDGPRCFIRAVGTAEGEGAVTGVGQQLLVGSVIAMNLQRNHH